MMPKPFQKMILKPRYYTFNLYLTLNMLLSVLFIFLAPAVAFAQEYRITFDQITIDDGLSESTVESIVQDAEGYMWFGTVDGLNKYDGYNFTIYRHDKNEANSLSDNWITALFVDKAGTLWIGTLGGWLNKYNHPTNSFSHYKPNSNPEKFDASVSRELPYFYSFLNSNSIKSICEDNGGNLWIGTFGSGLFKFDREKEKWIQIPYHNNHFSNCIMSLCITRDDTSSMLWIGTFGSGLLSYDLMKKNFQNFSLNQRQLSSDKIMSLYTAPDGNQGILWITTLGGGLTLFNYRDNKIVNFKHSRTNPFSLSSNNISSILRDDCGNLWVGTIGTGLDKLDLKDKKFYNYQFDPFNPNSLGNNDVLTLYKDRTGIIWIGAHFGNGINKLDYRRQKFMHYVHDPHHPNSLTDNTVVALCEDHDGILWIGSFQSGIDKLDRQQNRFINYRHDPSNPYSMSNNHVRKIFEDREGVLWIGTFAGGLNKFDRRQNTFIHFRHNIRDPYSISHDQVRAIYEDKSGDLWIGTFGGGLNKFDRQTEKFYHFQHDSTNQNSISDNRIYSIVEDNDGYLWIATFEGGLNKFNKKTGKFIHYKNDPADPNSINSNRILSVLTDRKNEQILWIGTHGGGLNKLDKREQIFRHYTKQHGLPNDIIYGILPDNDGNLWMSTNRGISKFNPDNETFTNYDRSDGLQSNEFNAGAYFQSVSGEMFFGGINGFNCFFPEKIWINEQIPPIVLTSFKIFDKETSHLIRPINATEEIELSHQDNFFSFEFSALDYTNVKKNQFAYKLDGLDENWIYCNNRRYVSYTNLDPGKYTFSVKGANSDGIWNEEGACVRLKILPPFWQTWWCCLFTTGIIVFVVIFFHRRRVRVSIKRSLELERIRIAENERVRKTVAADFHDELGQKLTRITLFSEIVKRRLENVAPENIEYVEKINKAAQELSSSTRDFIWTLDPVQDSLFDVVIYLKDFGDSIFDKTGIDFRVSGITKKLEHVRLPMKWRRHLILIFKEAMNNILRHANCSRAILDVKLKNIRLDMNLSDNGIGFNNNDPGSGKGLKNMKARAAAIGSQLFIDASVGKGTKISFTGLIT